MGTLQDALKNAIKPEQSGSLVAADAPPPVGVALLPEPAKSDWAARLRALGVPVPADAGSASLVQRTAALIKELDRTGRTRESKEIGRLRDEFLREREKRAWEGVKARFAEMDFPEKTYRALKQESADPEKVLARLYTRRAEEWRGIAAAKLRDQLLGK